MSLLLQELNETVAEVAERGRRSLVEVRSRGRGVGTGAVWHPDGLIVTNAHVVSRGEPQVRLPDGRILPAKVVAWDSQLDLAALLVEATVLTAIPLGASKSLRPGQWVLALGHPWGVNGAATAGVVIGTGKEWADAPQWGREWVAVDLPLRPGNSGGPLLDAEGRLVGISTIMAGPRLGLAVPVHVAKAFLRQTLHSPRAAAVA
jgi:serine protease Do